MKNIGFIGVGYMGYGIAKNILKKGRNIIAIRVTDTGGGGGFNRDDPVGHFVGGHQGDDAARHRRAAGPRALARAAVEGRRRRRPRRRAEARVGAQVARERAQALVGQTRDDAPPRPPPRAPLNLRPAPRDVDAAARELAWRGAGSPPVPRRLGRTCCRNRRGGSRAALPPEMLLYLCWCSRRRA